jgi:hypothetical protein
VSSSLELEFHAFERSVQNREAQQARISHEEQRKKTMDRIYVGLEDLSERWRAAQRNVEKSKAAICGDSVAIAAYLAYFGMFPGTLRDMALRVVADTLRAKSICSSEINQVFVARKMALLDQVNQDFYTRSGFHLSLQTEFDIRLIRACVRTPLIIDAHGLVMRFLLRAVKPHRLMTISLLSPRFETVLRISVEDGKTLLVDDVNRLTPLLADCLGSAFLDSRAAKVTIAQKEYQKDPKFRLFLFTSAHSPDDLPADLLSRVSITCATESSRLTTEVHLREVLRQTVKREQHPQSLAYDRRAIHQVMEQQHFERALLTLLTDISDAQQADTHYDCVEDEDTMDQFFENKGSYLAACRPTENEGQDEEPTSSAYRQLFKRCMTLWEVMSEDLPRLSAAYIFPFSDFTHILNTVIADSKLSDVALNDDEIGDLENAIVSATMDFLFAHLSLQHGLFAMTIWALKSRVDMTESIFRDLVRHLRDERDGLSDWRVTDFTVGDPGEHLKYTNIMNAFPLIIQLVVSEFGADWASRLPVFGYDILRSEMAYRPILITVKDRDVFPTILTFARIEKHLVRSVSLFNDPVLLTEIPNIVTECRDAGTWVVFHYFSPDPTVAGVLFDLVEDHSIHVSHFRIFIICSTVEHLPRRLIGGCLHLNYEDFPSPRHQVQEIFQHTTDLWHTAGDQQLIKSIMFSESVLFAIFSFRSFFRPAGFSTRITYHELWMRELIEKSKQQAELPGDDLKTFFVDILLSGWLSDEIDRRKLDTHFAKFIEAGEFVSASSPDHQIWSAPPPMPLSQYPRYLADTLPVIPSGGILLMSPQVAAQQMNYHLSRWALEPFKDLAPLPSLPTPEVRIRLGNLCAMIPPAIDLPPLKSMSGPLTLFFHGEIENFNRVVGELNSEIRKALDGAASPEIVQSLLRDEVPVAWGRIVGDLRHRQTSRFMMALQDQGDFYERWISNGLFGNHVYLEFVRDVKGLIASYLHEMSLQRAQPAVTGWIMFQVSDGIREHDAGLILNDAWLVGANFNVRNGTIVEVNQKTPAFVNIQQLVCVARWAADGGRPSDEKEKYLCPFYFQLPDGDGEVPDVDNFIGFVPLETEVPIATLQADGVALLCQLPAAFVPDAGLM